MKTHLRCVIEQEQRAPLAKGPPQGGQQPRAGCVGHGGGQMGGGTGGQKASHFLAGGDHAFCHQTVQRSHAQAPHLARQAWQQRGSSGQMRAGFMRLRGGQQRGDVRQAIDVLHLTRR